MLVAVVLVRKVSPHHFFRLKNRQCRIGSVVSQMESFGKEVNRHS